MGMSHFGGNATLFKRIVVTPGDRRKSKHVFHVYRLANGQGRIEYNGEPVPHIPGNILLDELSLQNWGQTLAKGVPFEVLNPK